MDELVRLRTQIDELDDRMRSLFVKRMEAVRAVAQYKIARKLPIEAPEREAEVLARNTSRLESGELTEDYLDFLVQVMRIAKQYQKRLKGESQ